MKLKLSEWKLATKLIIVNLSAVLVLGIILGIVFFSFKNIETSVDTIVRKEMPKVIANSRIGNDLTGMFADLLIRVFLGQEDTVKTRSDRFEQTITALAIRDTNPMLQSSLDRFRPELASLLDLSARIRETSEKFDTMGSDIIFTLETLQDIIAERMEKVEDKDSMSMRHLELLKSTGTRYREVFLDISVQVANLRAGNAQTANQEEHPIIADLNYFALSLETLPAADPEIAEQRRDLIKRTRDYKETVLRFLQTIAAFRKQIGDISDSKENIMTILKHTNEEIADTAEDIRKRIDTGTRLTGRIIIILSAGVFVVILLITYSVLNTFRVESQARVLAGEMELAKRIQTVLLPEKPEISGYDIAASCKAADEVGGDYYDVISVEGYDWIVVGDVSGHGVTSGLVMMMVQTSIHTVLLGNPLTSPSRLLSAINRVIYENIERMKESKHMTIIVIAAGKDGYFTFSGLHEDTLIWRADTGKTDAVGTDGMWIGLEPDISEMLSDSTLRLYPGDCMVLYTDGIIEAQCGTGEMFGDDRLREIVERVGSGSASEIHSAILRELDVWKTPDDVTLFVMKRV